MIENETTTEDKQGRNQQDQRDFGGAGQAQANMDSIREMVAALRAADNLDGDGRAAEDAREAAREAITNDALSVEVRSAWYVLDSQETTAKPAEFCILLCTGGPAVRITGELDENQEPESARLEHQDWGTPWTELRISGEDEAVLLDYARQFYFGGS